MTYCAPESKYAELLRTEGIRATPERVSVLSLLARRGCPLSAEEIWEELAGGIARSTVFRTLETFAESGVVYQTNFRDGRTRYEFHTKDTHHHHMVCVNCGKKEDVVVPGVERAVRNTSLPKSFRDLTSHTLEFFGVCKKCGR